MVDPTTNVKLSGENLALDTILVWKIYQLLARTYPLEDDEPFFRAKTLTVEPGKSRVIEWFVPSDSIWYLQEFAWNYESDSEYRINVDDGVLTTEAMDFSIQPIVLNPPARVYNKVRIKITNNSASNKTYNVYIKGWRRFK